ncbi:hypothetical protein DIE23_33625 [Burkholderia sp. Bp9143]|nr:hypothetical protein DIE23_33625 [Burkholderia sp. Bp9143]
MSGSSAVIADALDVENAAARLERREPQRDRTVQRDVRIAAGVARRTRIAPPSTSPLSAALAYSTGSLRKIVPVFRSTRSPGIANDSVVPGAMKSSPCDSVCIWSISTSTTPCAPTTVSMELS